jgi:hypothetical protein
MLDRVVARRDQNRTGIFSESAWRPYVNMFADYVKEAFLGAVAALHRGLFKPDKSAKRMRGVRSKTGTKTETAYRMIGMVPEAQIDELIRLADPFRDFRDSVQHSDVPTKPTVRTVRMEQSRPTIGTFSGGFVDPFSLYELLKSLEPAVGYVAFVKAALQASIQQPPSK